MRPGGPLGVCAMLCGAALAWAGSIETAFLEQPWPKQRTRDYEVGKYAVQWRQAVKGRGEEIFAGAAFVSPAAPQATWDLATDYPGLGTMTPGVEQVQVLEDTPARQAIQIDIKVLWKKLRLVFEIEREPPSVARFRLVNEVVGEYRGLCRMSPAGEQTRVELATWLRPAVRVPPGLILWVERVAMLRGIREFLKDCEQAAPSVARLTVSDKNSILMSLRSTN